MVKPRATFEDSVPTGTAKPASKKRQNHLAPSPGPHSKMPLLRRQSSFEVVEDVARTGWMLTRLAFQLLWMLRTGGKWVWMLIRLLLFVIALLPAFIKGFSRYLFDRRIIINVAYGYQKRQSLDIYMVGRQTSDLPVVIFVSGGAWIIGYKLWAFLMGTVMQNFGVILVSPDYRNFPQATISTMIEDISLAVRWTLNNIEEFGGDPDNITLIGQSAGAHISACLVLRQAEKQLSGKKVSWEASKLRRYIGISGPYDMITEIEVFHERGLDKNIQNKIFEENAEYFSPTLRTKCLSENYGEDFVRVLPPITLFHGTADETVSWTQSDDFAQVLSSCGATVGTKMYEGKTHTDPILEDPINGNDPLLADILELIQPDISPDDAEKPDSPFRPSPRMVPLCLIQFARLVNPF